MVDSIDLTRQLPLQETPFFQPAEPSFHQLRRPPMPLGFSELMGFPWGKTRDPAMVALSRPKKMLPLLHKLRRTELLGLLSSSVSALSGLSSLSTSYNLCDLCDLYASS